MARILKYQLKTFSEQKVKTCAGKVLTVKFQHGNPMMWVLVDDETKMVERVVQMVGTGITFIPNKAQYLTTILIDYGNLVLHVFVEEATPIAEN